MICIRCKIAMIEIIKNVWRCSMCKTIVNERLKNG